MGTQRLDFAEFYRRSRDDCLRTVLVSVGDRDTAQDLVAWTVFKQADGTVSVTIRELRDPAGLQRRLRADGVPASVTFFGQLPRSCQRYPVDSAMINRVFTGRRAGRSPVMVIHPSALPRGAGVAISSPAQPPIMQVAIGLVQAAPRCTGS